jgi:hypothetical protein
VPETEEAGTDKVASVAAACEGAEARNDFLGWLRSLLLLLPTLVLEVLRKEIFFGTTASDAAVLAAAVAPGAAAADDDGAGAGAGDGGGGGTRGGAMRARFKVLPVAVAVAVAVAVLSGGCGSVVDGAAAVLELGAVAAAVPAVGASGARGERGDLRGLECAAAGGLLPAGTAEPPAVAFIFRFSCRLLVTLLMNWASSDERPLVPPPAPPPPPPPSLPPLLAAAAEAAAAAAVFPK